MKGNLYLMLSMLAGILFVGPVAASDGNEFTPTQEFTDPFPAQAGPDGPLLLPGSVRLTPREIDRLILPRAGRELSLPSIDRFTGNEAEPLRFRPLSLFAEGARIRVMRDGKEYEQSRAARHYYLASRAGTAVGLAVDPVSGEVSGVVAKGGGRLKIGGDVVSRLEFHEMVDPGSDAFSCGNAEHDLASESAVADAGLAFMSQSSADAGEVISYQAVVAVETDTEWLVKSFDDDTDAAMAWITDLFLAMNVYYERDIETRLLIGDVFLRTGSDPDPYQPTGSTSDRLYEFGEYWSGNMGGVERQFAAMFSGRDIGGWAFSGIAWVGAYCNDASSYSYNGIKPNMSAAWTAHYVGHELGHNLGSPHTHCYSPEIDRCASGGSFKGTPCYNGSTACPADGSGTVMSYCHGLAGCSSQSEFHPVVQGVLEDRLADEMVAGCIMPYTNPATIFSTNFED